MNLFFDTSALVKFFHEEEGTEAVTDLILDANNQVWISELARLEFLSTVFRRFRNKELDEERLNTAVHFFENQVDRFNIEPLGHAVLEEAALILKNHGRRHGLKALDALHLGTYGLISEDDWAFVATDESLCDVAKAIGYNIINPLKGNA
jgi:predicted nucleic acid-binding protein